MYKVHAYYRCSYGASETAFEWYTEAPIVGVGMMIEAEEGSKALVVETWGWDAEDNEFWVAGAREGCRHHNLEQYIHDVKWHRDTGWKQIYQQGETA